MKQDLRSFIRNIINEEYELIKSVMYEQTETLQQYITASNQDLTGKSTSGNASLSAQAGIKPPVRQLPANLISKLNADRNSLLQWGNWFTKNQTAIKNSRQSAGWKTIITSQESSLLGKFLKANADALIKPGVGTQIADPTGGLGVGIETTKQSVKWAEIKKGLYDEWAKCYNNTECRTNSIANNIIIAKGNLQGIRLNNHGLPPDVDAAGEPFLVKWVADLLPDELSWMKSNDELAYQIAKSITVLGLAAYKDDNEWLAIKSILKMKPGDWDIVNAKVKKRTGEGITDYLLTFIIPESATDPTAEFERLFTSLMAFLWKPSSDEPLPDDFQSETEYMKAYATWENSLSWESGNRHLNKGPGDPDYEKLADYYWSMFLDIDGDGMIDTERIASLTRYRKKSNNRYMSQKLGLTLSEFEHQKRQIDSFVFYFLPTVGPWISAGILGYDAKKYLDEKNKYAAGLNVFFALLGVVPSITRAIPVLRNTNARVRVALSNKLATSNYKALNNLDLLLFKDVSRYLPFIKKDLTAYMQRRFKNQLLKAMQSQSTYSALYRRIGPNGIKILNLLARGGRLAEDITRSMAPYVLVLDQGVKVWDDLWAEHPEWNAEAEKYAAQQALKTKFTLPDSE